MEHQEEPAAAVNRRRLLRGAGAVLAGTAGAAVAGGVVADPAAAAAGSPIIAGQSNDGGSSTELTANDGSSATLELNNTFSVTDSEGNVRAGATLRLTPEGDLLSDTAPIGSIGMTNDGTLWLVPGTYNGALYRHWIYTTGNANMTIPLVPDRAIDTRTASTRTRILNPSALDSSGHVRGGQTIIIDLSSYTAGSFAYFINVTAVSPTADGFLTVFPTGLPRPTTSSLDWSHTLGALANFAVVGTGLAELSEDDIRDSISLYVNSTVHVLVDVMAVTVAGAFSVNPAYLGSALAAPDTRARMAKPKRATPQPWQAKVQN